MRTGIMLDESSPTYSRLCPNWTASMQTPRQRNSRELNKEVRKGMKVIIVIINATLTCVESFLLPALATGYAELLVGSKELDLILNGLVSSISGIIVSPGSNSTSAVIGEGLQKLTTLNTLSEVDNTFWSRVKEFRVVMLLKTVLNWPTVTEGSHSSWVVSTEILRLLKSLLPWIKHIDGEFWEMSLNLVNKAFKVLLSVIDLTF